MSSFIGRAPKAPRQVTAPLPGLACLFPDNVPATPINPMPLAARFLWRDVDHLGLALGALGTLDLDDPHAALLLGAHEIDMEQAIVEPGSRYLDPFGEHEGTLELARRDAAMQVDALLVVGLPAPHDELVVLDLDREVVHSEASDGTRDAQLGLA